MSANPFSEISQIIGGLIEHLSPQETRKLAMEIGRDVRRENAKRMRDNVEPDGSRMVARQRERKTRDKKGNKVRAKKQMFQNLWRSRHFKVQASAAGASVGWSGEVGRTARAHQFGARIRKVTLPSRQVVGLSQDDEAMMLDRVVKHLRFEG